MIASMSGFVCVNPSSIVLSRRLVESFCQEILPVLGTKSEARTDY